MTKPTKAGFYWAKLINPRGYEDESEYWPDPVWRPVDVIDYGAQEDEQFGVAVLGLDGEHLLQDFEWGPAIPAQTF